MATTRIMPLHVGKGQMCIRDRVSNSMTELYTMQRYLQYERLQELNMTHFDCWASRFGETVTALELAPEGTGYRARTRFSKFFNLPELMNLFKEVADIKTADQLNLPTPEVEYHNVVAQPTEHQQEMVKALSERASEVHRGSVDPSVDNMLKITSDGRKLGLDQRIINQLLPDEPGTKVNQCVDNIMQIWRDGDADKLTQLVFCDISTPQSAPSKKAAKQLDNPLLHGLEAVSYTHLDVYKRQHSDRENAVIEGNAAIRRAVLGSGDLELIRLYSDVPEFRQRLHREVIDETYPRLHEMLRPLSQDDIDDAIRAWNGDIQSKHAVVRYMEQHGREKDTAAWLAQEYSGSDSKSLFVIRAGSPEGIELPWPLSLIHI